MKLNMKLKPLLIGLPLLLGVTFTVAACESPSTQTEPSNDTGVQQPSESPDQSGTMTSPGADQSPMMESPTAPSSPASP